MIGTLVPAGVGLALSPVPLVQLILVLFSRRRAANTVAFIVTLLALSAAAVAAGALGEQATESSTGKTSSGTSVLLVALGLVLLLPGLRNRRNRADPSEPAILERISGIGPGAAALLGLGATWANPKNLVLLLNAGQTIKAADPNAPLLVAAIFILLATAPYTVASAYALLGGESAPATGPCQGLAGQPQPPDHGRDLHPARRPARRQGAPSLA